MPIGDLLAEISSGQPSSVTHTETAALTGTKRKAEDGSNGPISTKHTKTRLPDGTYSSSKINRNEKGHIIKQSYLSSTPARGIPSRPADSVRRSASALQTGSPSTNGRPTQHSVGSSQRSIPSANGKPPSGSSSAASNVKSYSGTAGRPKLNPAASAAPRAPAARPSPTTPTNADPSKAPKKGSFAEIMARGAKAQQVMGKVGMIQHKAIDKPISKKEREVNKTEQKPSTVGKSGNPYLGNGRPSTTSARDAARSGAQVRDALQNGLAKGAKASGSRQRPSSAGADSEVKKIKKSTTATTGYTGTARARPGATTNKSSSLRDGHGSSSARVGGLLASPRTSRRDRYEDEYDDELDDFIEYDDEEDVDPRGRGNGYASDGSSDMEAGLSDIDVEERRAELAALEEDRKEKALEERHRREKEERKRQWAARAGK